MDYQRYSDKRECSYIRRQRRKRRTTRQRRRSTSRYSSRAVS